MAKDLMPLIDTEEVEHILHTYYECDEDCDAKVDLLMKCVEDGTIKDFLYETFDTWAFQNYWEVVEDAVMDWSKDVLSKADNTDRE